MAICAPVRGHVLHFLRTRMAGIIIISTAVMAIIAGPSFTSLYTLTANLKDFKIYCTTEDEEVSRPYYSA